MSASQHFYCISHAPLSWPLPDFMTVIGTGDYRPKGGIAMSERFPKLAHQNRYLGEYVALYAIRDLLLEADAQGFVGLCHYRRFALSHPIGELRGFNYHAHPSLLATVCPEHYYHDGATPIIPATVHFQGTIIQQYAANCITRDLLTFFSDAVDCGVISDPECAAFLSQNAFITAPTVAYIPVEWFVEIVHSLEKVMSRFYRNHYIERTGYLQRSMAFCCERLQALLLAKKADAWGRDRLIAQPLTLLIPDPA
jgi:hypothetical protein